MVVYGHIVVYARPHELLHVWRPLIFVPPKSSKPRTKRSEKNARPQPFKNPWSWKKRPPRGARLCAPDFLLFGWHVFKAFGANWMTFYITLVVPGSLTSAELTLRPSDVRKKRQHVAAGAALHGGPACVYHGLFVHWGHGIPVSGSRIPIAENSIAGVPQAQTFACQGAIGQVARSCSNRRPATKEGPPFNNCITVFPQLLTDGRWWIFFLKVNSSYSWSAHHLGHGCSNSTRTATSSTSAGSSSSSSRTGSTRGRHQAAALVPRAGAPAAFPGDRQPGAAAEEVSGGTAACGTTSLCHRGHCGQTCGFNTTMSEKIVELFAKNADFRFIVWHLQLKVSLSRPSSMRWRRAWPCPLGIAWLRASARHVRPRRPPECRACGARWGPRRSWWSWSGSRSSKRLGQKKWGWVVSSG